MKSATRGATLTNGRSSRWWTWVPPLVAVTFGGMTILEGGSVLFGDEAARRAAGNYVPYVLWFDFLAGFACVAAVVGPWKRTRWCVGLSFGRVGTERVDPGEDPPPDASGGSRS